MFVLRYMIFRWYKDVFLIDYQLPITNYHDDYIRLINDFSVAAALI